MEKFPEMTVGQVALLRAEVATGHVLDEALAHVIGDNQRVYTVLSNYEEALSLAYLIIASSGNEVECVIYNERNEILDCLRS